MALYRVLLADDEEEIREGIIRKIDWEALGFTVAGDAENGLDALEKAEHLRPDVVITDIKMPFLSGLELGERLQTEMPATKLIIFSGFDDFEYAQKAIQLNAAEYILKPVNSAELTETLKKLRVKLDREFNEKRDVELLRRNYMDSLPVMREQFLVGLIEGRIPENRMRSQAERFNVSLTAQNRAVALVRADTAFQSGGALHGEEELVPLSLKCTVDEILKSYCRFTAFLYSDCVIVIAEFGGKDGVLALVNGMNEVCRSAERVLGARVMAGVGTPRISLSDLRHSYREAQNALDYSAALGAGRAIYIADVEPDASVKLRFDEHDEREMVNAIKMGQEEEIRRQVGALFDRFETMLPPPGQYQIYLMEIMTAMLKVMRACDLSTEEVFGRDFRYLDRIMSLHVPADMKRWCAESCVKISNLIRRERVDSAKLLAQNAKDYITANFRDSDLSVERICSFLHVSPAYFSTVFKRETGMSFVAYLTETRLQEAVNLLNTTDDKSYVIAEKVGYTEPNYFSYVFKKRFGVSPSRYRSKP